jgi:hypothetical protein
MERVLGRRGGPAMRAARGTLRARRRAVEARLPRPALRSLRRTARHAFSESLAAIRF